LSVIGPGGLRPPLRKRYGKRGRKTSRETVFPFFQLHPFSVPFSVFRGSSPSLFLLIREIRGHAFGERVEE
jgi:hypothetical protein